MKYLVLSFCLLMALNMSAQQTLDKTMTHGGVTREYRLYIPSGYNANTAAPLLFNLHGYSSNNVQQELYSNFKPIADTANFIMCLPNGTLDLSSNRYWNVGFAPSTVDDVDFLSTLLDTLMKNYNIDAKRVYSTGMSNGGFMSYSLACQLSDRIAAIASVTGSMTTSQRSNCNPSRTVPVMQIHGTNDPTVPYAGTSLFLHMDTLIADWVKRNGCTGAPNTTAVPNTVLTDGSTATRLDYNNCNPGGKVAFYKVQNGEHTWPGAGITIGVTNKDFNASHEIWKFFLQHQLPDNSVSVNEVQPAAQEVRVYPNPSNSIVHFVTAGAIEQASVYDFSGRAQPIRFETTDKTLHVEQLPAGMYYYVLRFADGSVASGRVVKQ